MIDNITNISLFSGKTLYTIRGTVKARRVEGVADPLKRGDGGSRERPALSASRKVLGKVRKEPFAKGFAAFACVIKGFNSNA